MFKSTCLALAVVAATSAFAATAEVPARGAPALKRPAASGAATRPLPRKPLPFLTFKPLALDLKLIPLSDMTGWTAITSAPTVGSASLFSANGQSWLAVTGSDNTVYVAPYNAASPSAISSTSWVNIEKLTLWSEPRCLVTRFDFSDQSQDYVFCLGLGQKGNAVGATLAAENGELKHWHGPVDLGGHDAGGTPVILSEALRSDDVIISSTSKWYKRAEFSLAVWGGAANPKLFIGRVDAGLSGAIGPVAGLPGVAWNMTMAKADGGDWTPASITFAAAPACIPAWGPTGSSDCVAATTDNTVALYSMNGSPPSVTFSGKISSALSVGLSGATALVRTKAGRRVVIVRGKDGKVYQAVYQNGTFSPWRSEGGFMTSGTTPACIALNEAPACIIQGPDGKLYGKVLQNAGAM